MSTARTPWHVYFAVFMKEIAPPGIEVTFEVTLTTEPQRGDLLLLHREEVPRRDSDARAFLGLWPLLRTDTLVEFKSLAWPLQKGDLSRLQGYGAQYFTAQVDRPLALRDLALVLILPTRTPTLVHELARMEWTATALGNGYDRIEGAGYALYVVIMTEVTGAEKDDLLGLFSGRTWTRKQITWWWRHRTGSMGEMNMQDMPGTDEIIQEMLDSLPPEQRLAGLAPEQRLAGLAPEVRLAGLAPEVRLAGLAPKVRVAGLAPKDRVEGLAPKDRVEGLAPEERLAGLAPEQRLAGLAPEQQVLALSDEVLRGLSPEYLSTLPADVQEAIRRRIGTKATP